MERDQLFNAVSRLRDEGRSIRAIAAELGTNRSKVERALKALNRAPVAGGTPPLPAAQWSQGIFVGRQREMFQLQVAWDKAVTGGGNLIMLVGEPGIGKTRTAQELALHAEGEGAHVLWGSCYEEAGAPPYWPWVQSLRAYIRQQDPNRLRQQMGPSAADIAEIIPQVLEKLPGLEPPPALDPEQARFRFFDSITTFLKNASQTQPLMLVLDDLHWADKLSLLLLEFLARNLLGSSLLVVGCYRNTELSRQHPLSETLAQLSREPVFQRVPLRGFSREDAASFIEVVAGIQPSQQLVATLYAHTEGNPFFMSEVIRLLLGLGQHGNDTIDGLKDLKIPEGIREVIGQRLNRLTDQCYQTLTAAAVVGREFDFKLIHTLNRGGSEEQLLEVIDEALAAHVIRAAPHGEECYQFSHALVQQALTEELSPSRRVRTHARIGEALEELYGDDREVHAAELAYHFAQARRVLGPDKLVGYSRLAGEQALTAYAWEEALGHFEKGLGAKGVSLTGDEPAPDSDAAALLFGLGQARAATLERHQLQDAIGSISRAFSYYAEAGDMHRAVAAARAAPRTGPGHQFGGVDLVARALELVPPGSREAGYLLARHGELVARTEGAYDKAREAFSQALCIAQQEGDIDLEINVLTQWGGSDYTHLNNRDCLERSLRTLELARSVGDPAAEVDAHHHAGLVLFCTGNLTESQHHASVMLTAAHQLRDRAWLATAYWRSEATARAKGDWPGAREFSNLGLAVSPGDPRLLGTRAQLEYQTGEFIDGAAYLEQVLANMDRAGPGPTLDYVMPAVAIPFGAYLTGRADRLRVAATAAESVLASPFVSPFIVLLARIGLALVAVLQKDPVVARDQYIALKPRGGTMLPQTMAIAADRLLGLLSQTYGRLEQATVHFEDALAFCRNGGYRPELAWTCYDYADTLFRRNQPGDRSRGISLLDEARSISTELGMKPLMERVSVQLKGLETQLAPDYPDGLSHREVEVLRLIATGKTDRQIAEELVIADGTVRRHISNIYPKIKATNRAEATRYALGKDLLSLDE